MSMLPYETRVDRELLFNCFLSFSRFEYALKASGLFKRTDPGRNDPSRPITNGSTQIFGPARLRSRDSSGQP